jgi:hypothetical protein
MHRGATIEKKPVNGAGTERKPEASGGLSLYIPVPGMPIGGFSIDDGDTRARIDRGARVSTRSGLFGDVQTPRRLTNAWIW